MYGVIVSNKGGSAFQAKSKDSEFTIDTKGRGITPPDALLASLGSCIGVYLRKYAEGAKLDIGEFEISVEADLSMEAPVSFRQISVVITIKDKGLDERRQKAILDFIKNCPVHNTLRADPVVDIRIS